MEKYVRYAIYYAPKEDSALGEFGDRWFGRNLGPNASDVPAYDIGIERDEFEHITMQPKKYGFHGTLKPPFELADGVTLNDLQVNVGNLTKKFRPFCLRNGLKLKTIGSFLALVPEIPSDELFHLAAGCVRELDELRKPLSMEKVKERRKSGLSERQDELLLEWGYPYVLEEFQFHLTLTSSIKKSLQEKLAHSLSLILNPIIDSDIYFDDVVLFGDPGDGKSFQPLQRFRLGI